MKKKKRHSSPPGPNQLLLLAQIMCCRWENERVSALLVEAVTDIAPEPDLSDFLKAVQTCKLGKGDTFVFCLWNAATSGREKVPGANRRSRTFLKANKITNVFALTNSLTDRLHMEPTEVFPPSYVVW